MYNVSINVFLKSIIHDVCTCLRKNKSYINYLHSRKRRLRIRLSQDFAPNVVRAYVPHLQWNKNGFTYMYTCTNWHLK